MRSDDISSLTRCSELGTLLRDFEIDNDNPQSRRRFFFLPLNELVVNLASSKLGNLEKIANFLRNASHSQGLEACGSSANSKPEKYQSAADRLRRWLSNRTAGGQN
jgi:hypothetical protein